MVMDINEYKLEKEKLKQIIETVKETIEHEQESLENIYHTYVANIEDLWKVANAKRISISNLEQSLNNPYFARIDFTSDENKQLETIYIGKKGIMKDTNVVVADWRAPISSLYYDAEIGKCNYTSPGGIVSGDMSLKRQFDIKDGELIQYFDVELVSQDDLLQKYLNTNNDSRLKTIVSTIQKEQNDVIRRAMTNNLIIQGVAGSGKTTVALHRIAYLVYNHMKDVKQNQYMVIGPNPVFLKYIKSVLPELDVADVEQYTYEEFVKKYIGEDIQINSSEKKLVKRIAEKNTSDIDKFKCSMKYKEMLEQFMKVYFYSITSKPLTLEGCEIVSSKELSRMFAETESKYRTNLASRIEATINRVCRYIEDNYASIYRLFTDYTVQSIKNLSSEEEKSRKKVAISKAREELSKHCRSTVRKYFNKSKLDATKLYKLFVSSISDYDLYNYPNLSELKKITLSNINKKVYDFEDLAPLLYIQELIAPNKDYSNMKHIVIDEAQDLGAFNFYTMKRGLPSATFSIFGDLAQSIYDYRSIDDWKTVNEVMFEGNANIVEFNKSYRSTSEIMSVADEVADLMGLGKSELVVRHGELARLTSVGNEKDIPNYISQRIAEFKEKGYKTIAVISKTELLSHYINDDLGSLSLQLPNVSINDDLNDEQFSICTISNQLAKGLEFDAVIINNASERIYSSHNNLDMKLLYVAITRALHEIDIVYSGELTKPLENYLEKSKQRILTK